MRPTQYREDKDMLSALYCFFSFFVLRAVCCTVREKQTHSVTHYARGLSQAIRHL